MVERRGRKPGNLSIVTPSDIRKPTPPIFLSKDEAEDWRALVEQMPATWFSRENHAVLLRLVCSNRICCDLERRLRNRIFEDDDLDTYDQLLNMYARMAKLSLSCATKLRLTPQSRYESNSAGSRIKNATSRPWEPDVD